MIKDSDSGIVRFDFDGDAIDVVAREGCLWVSVASVSRNLGIAPNGQIVRLKRLSWASHKIILSQPPGDIQRRAMFYLDVRCVPLWLATINASKVRAPLRRKLTRYQREAAEVLANHFLGTRGGGAVLDDHPEEAARVWRLLCDVARKVKRTAQRVHGFLRRAFRVSSYRYIACSRVETVRAALREIEAGRIVISSSPPRPLLTNGKQAAFPFAPSR